MENPGKFSPKYQNKWKDCNLLGRTWWPQDFLCENGGQWRTMEDIFSLLGGHFEPKMEDNWRTICKIIGKWRTSEDKCMLVNTCLYLVIVFSIPSGSHIHVNIPFSQHKCHQLFPSWDHTT